MATRLTKRSVDALAPQAKPFTAFDLDVKGFGVRIHPTGRKVWVIEYRPGGGGRGVAKTRYTFATLAEVLTPEEARKRARHLLGHVREGRDPARERAEQREAATVQHLAERFMAEEIGPTRKPGTVRNYRKLLDKHILPMFGEKRARDVTYSDVAKLHRAYRKLLDKHILPMFGEKRARDVTYSDVAKLHRATGERGQVTANRSIELLRALFNWAVKAGELPKGHDNPAAGITRFREEPRETFLDETQLARLGATLALAETDGLPYYVDEAGPKAKHAPKPGNRRVKVSAHATGAIRLLLLTGCRLREILTLKWADVDLGRGLINLPDEKSKTGKRSVLINAPVDALAQIRIGDYVVAGDRADQPRADLQRPWMQIKKHAGLDGVRLHDLRHTHASYGAGAGLGLPVIGALLGHRQASTTMRYSHLHDSVTRRASETIGATIAAALGQPVKPPANVLPIRKGA
jgi:integrase